MNKTKLLSLLFSAGLAFSSYAADIVVSQNGWKMTLNENTKKMDIEYNDASVLTQAYAMAKYGRPESEDVQSINSYECTQVNMTSEEITDNRFGSGKKVTFIYTMDGLVDMVQDFYFYDKYPYFLVRLTLADEKKVTSNHLSPLMSQSVTPLLPKEDSNRILIIPWDNDGFNRYSSKKFGQSATISSPEVTAIYCGESRKGLVVGSVEHDTWKSAVSMATQANGNLSYLKCLSGYTNLKITRDALPHGKITGEKVSSSLFIVGLFDDWRRGMEAFADANVLVAPPAPWDGGDPFGWSSWGAMQTRINNQGILDVMSFLNRDEFKAAGFGDELGRKSFSLDAWYNDNLSIADIVDLAENCKTNNNLLGIYSGFLCRWKWQGREDAVFPGSKWKVKDVLLKVNGEEYPSTGNPGALCVDPTHPGIISAMKYDIQRYKLWGAKYIKMDFMNCGIMEGDSYYVKEITTGVQAYNYFMKQMYDYIQQQMPGTYVVLSISPLFPYQYTTGRRTTCDAWGAPQNSQYVMNATSYGWWTDRLYTANDPDHLVMIGANYDNEQNVTSAAEFTEGENRMRLTSGAVTGAYIVGDNFSDNCKDGKGKVVGNPALSRERALKFLTNKDVNAMVRECKAFYPIEGHQGTDRSGGIDIPSEKGSEKLMMYETDKYVYVAVFSYQFAQQGTINFSRIGVASDNVKEIKELWNGTSVTFTNSGFEYNVPATDAHIYRITKKEDVASEGKAMSEDNTLKIKQNGALVSFNSEIEMTDISVVSTAGNILLNKKIADYTADLDLSRFGCGMYIMQVSMTNNKQYTHKIILNEIIN